MILPQEFGNIEPWAVYADSDKWPITKDFRFIVDATAQVIDTRFGIGLNVVAFDRSADGYRDVVADDIRDMLINGNLIAWARPVGGGRMVTIADAEWTKDTAEIALATGFFLRKHRGKPSHPHHVFIGAEELKLMLLVYGWTNMMFLEEEQDDPVFELATTVLSHLSAIAGNKVALAPMDSTRRVYELLFPESRPALHSDDEDKLVAMAAKRLIERFKIDDKDNTALVKADFCEDALRYYTPFMTKRLFDKVWARATAAGGSNKKRSSPGRRKRLT